MSREWTPEQRELFEVTAGRLALPRVAVAADAGAGKTSVLVERVKALPPELRVLCVSFTEKSKADLEQKLSEQLGAEVYTIHGFCGRVVSEFGSALGLPPFLRIMDADERDEIFYRSFEKVYRRCPPTNLEHGVNSFWSICRLASEAGPDARIHDCSAIEGDADLERFTAEVLGEFADAKRLQRVLEYSDLELYALDLLRRPEVSAALRARYGHVFVDEFQDTSRLQCELVELLTGTEGQVFVVGDQKQSIYRFRGADVAVFNEYVKRLPARRRLSSNFRSHASIIDATNAVCAPLIEGYGPMQSGRPEDRGELSPEVFEGLPRVARITAETDADAIEAILKRLRARGVDWSEIVLLVRRIKGNEDLFQALAERGIGAAITSSSSASSNEELRSLLNLWIWACEPWQRLRAAQVVTDFELGLRAELDLAISDLNRSWNERPGALSPRTSAELLGELETRFALHSRFGAVYEQFEVFILSHHSQGLAPNVLARRLHHLLSNGQDITNFVLLPPPANLSGAIRVLTVHGSKGLEFPVVILGDVGKQRKRSLGILKRGSDIWAPGREDSGELDWSAPELQNAKAFEEEAETAESARLLYVAMTRAQEALYVVDRGEVMAEPLTKSGKEKKPSAKKVDTSWSAWLKAGLSATLPAEIFSGAAPKLLPGAPLPGNAARSSPLAELAPVYRRARVGISQLAAELALASPPAPAAPAGPPLTASSSSAELGTAIHKFFELEDWEGLRAAARAHRLDLTAFWRWLESVEGRKAFGKSLRACPEFAFEARLGEAVVTGRIDRLVLLDPGEAWVIDYKVLGRPRPLADVTAEYGPQLRLYRDAVKKMTKCERVRAFILDVTCATGSVWFEVR